MENAGGVQNTDREHCAPIAWSFLVYKAAMHEGGFVRAWNCAFICRTVHLHKGMLRTAA